MPAGIELPPAPVPLARLARAPLILPPRATRCATRSRRSPRPQRVELRVPIEVEGIRLIADLVASGAGVSILPETAVPTEFATCAPWRSPSCRPAGSRS